MRKIFFGFTAISLLALLATSCSNESVEQSIDLNNVIAFKATTGKQTFTRASEFTLEKLKNEQLEVNSYRSDNGNSYKDYTISFDGSLWSYGVPEYHPLNYDLNHYSVHPLSGVTQLSSSSFQYLVAATYDKQVDLMVAIATTTSEEPTANLVYKHILSQVNFAIQGKKNLNIEISDIKLSQIGNVAKYSFKTGWPTTLHKSLVEYSYIPAVDAYTPGIEDDEILYLGNTGDGASVVDNTNDNALMLIPQTLHVDAVLSFNYKLYNNKAIFDNGSISVNLKDLGVTKWEEGKRYLYILNFDLELLKFDVEVEENWIDFNDPDGGVIDVVTPN